MSRKRKLYMSSDQSQQAPSGGGKTGRRVSKVSVIVWVAVLLVVGVVLFVCFTERGQVMMGNIENQGLWNWLFGEGDEKAESEAIVELEKCGVRVIKETGKGVTSIDFSNCLKPSDETMKQIAKLCQLSTAIFLNAEINDDQLGYLKNLRHLNNLLINGTPITDAGLCSWPPCRPSKPCTPITPKFRIREWKHSLKSPLLLF